MKFLTIQRAGLGPVSIPVDRISSIEGYGDGARVNYARADGSLDYLHDERQPLDVLHALDCANAPRSDAPLRGFVEVTLDYSNGDFDGCRLFVASKSVIGVYASRVPDGGSWAIVSSDALPTGVADSGSYGSRTTIVGVRESFTEMKARLAEASR